MVVNILQRLWQSVKTHGYPSTFGDSLSPSALRAARGKRRQRPFLEAMENRVLLTAIYGGETFTYTDSGGKAITVQLNGNVSAEMIAAIQSSNGALAFGNIAGGFGTGQTK